MSRIGVVVIGRNEGERLKRCLRSLVGPGHQIVYVDSGSTDGSVQFARSLGVDVVDLDMSQPFTMARGRNTGFARLCEISPQIEYVQFVDGDCEVDPHWIKAAETFLDAHADVAAVSGRRRERSPEASVYNMIADLEWSGPPGESMYCTGDALMRRDAVEQVGGYDPTLIAGEEPELCARFAKLGWRMWRLDAGMTLHDAAMLRFSQWWKRSVRVGHAYAEVAAMHGSEPQRHKVRETVRAVLWGATMPLVMTAVLACAVVVTLVKPFEQAMQLAVLLILGAAVAGMIGMYLLLGARVYRYRRSRGDEPRASAVYTFYCILGKTPEAVGAASYWFNRLRGRRRGLIEYK